ncbi:hypothetical protein [Methanoculleus chikugoensis]|uniref:Uncharacterized protein n=1 Tax=Methanoculleus chikugoensis TaxID=118126 RepID=A0ABN5XFF9_9EURY|nr:hypothetical protein [Methanoculleus chikugoensis]BBL67387.1 hypothetical protein MchiMG62_05680 [Methanoculleus chikugoensis]
MYNENRDKILLILGAIVAVPIIYLLSSMRGGLAEVFFSAVDTFFEKLGIHGFGKLLSALLGLVPPLLELGIALLILALIGAVFSLILDAFRIR